MINQIINDNCLKILPKIDDEIIDIIITDPPFFIRKKITIHRQQNLKKSGFDKDGVMRWKYKGTDIKTGWEWDDIWESEGEYLAWCYEWYNECVRVLREGGHFLCFFDRLRQWWLYRWGDRLNMLTRQSLYYILKNPVPRARKIDFMQATYLIFWQTKGTYSKKKSTFNYELGQHRNYIEVPIAPTPKDRKRHPTEKHEKVIEWLLSYLSKEGDLVLDPFAGSGTTGAVAKKMNRNYILIEKNKEFYEMCVKRLNSIPKRLDNF